MDELKKGFPIKYKGLTYKVAEVGHHKNIVIYAFRSKRKIELMSHGAFEENLTKGEIILKIE